MWSVLASLGLAIPGIILFMRVKLVCPTLELEPFALLPLSGIVNGHDPHLFCRIMHDLMHPIVLLCYAVVLTCVAVRLIHRPLSVRSNQFLFSAVLLVHLICLISYFITLFLPVGDMISVISR